MNYQINKITKKIIIKLIQSKKNIIMQKLINKTNFQIKK